MNSVAIVDYGMGNLDSVSRAVVECGKLPVITKEKSVIEDAGWIILPGDGSFNQGMKNIQDRGLEEILVKEVIEEGKPFMGLCLGMQLLATEGREGGRIRGFGWIEGEVRRLNSDDVGFPVPHIGWNEVVYERPSPLFFEIPTGKDFYFVHSYLFDCKDEADVLARTPYCEIIVSVVNKDNIFGVQFHPEISQRYGIKLIRNFLNI